MQKKILAVLLSLAMLLSMVACAGTPAEPAAPEAASVSFTPGTYNAEAEGISSTVKVAVTVSEDAITDIEIVEHAETRNIGIVAMDLLIDQILEHQTLAVDVVSSVSFSSRALISAVTDACKQAGADLSLLQKKIAPQADETVTADVVVVGMGLAGVTASMSALDEGATVVAVEKMGAAGGSSRYSGGFITAFETETQLSQGFTMTADDFVQSYYAQQDASVKAEEIDREAISAMIHRSAADIDFLNSHGITLNPNPTDFGAGIGYWFFPAERTGPFDGHAAGADHILKGIARLNENENFSIYYNAPAVEILTDDAGNITGVLCERTDGSKLTVNAKSVVLSSGGWAASPEMMARFCPDFPQEWVLPYTTSNMGNTGDGITMAEALGAAVYEDGWWMDLANGVDVGGYQTYMPETLNGMIDYNLHFVVNGNGERCTNTSSLYGPRSIDYAKAMKETGAVFAIYTNNILPGAIELIENEGRVDGYNIYKADTLEDLAAQTGMDPDTLVAQVARYNEMSAAGVDTDFGQAAYKMLPVGEAPYYALRIKTITMGTIGGLKTNDDNQVLNTAGQPIPGLFAAGELINGKYFNQCYVSGCAQLLCTDSGIIAGANAAKAAK